MSNKKIALITGGIGGIGTAICRKLSQQGKHVYANYYPAEEQQAIAWKAQQAADGFEIDIVGADVAAFEDCAAMVKKIEGEAGAVNILVNNAGITRDKTLKNMNAEEWRAVIQTNLDSVFNVTRQVFEGMISRGFGRVVNISSVNGQRGQFGQANYASSKAGIHGFTMSIAFEGAARGVTANSISPGFISTPMTQAMAPEILESIVADIPMRKMGAPSDIANLVEFLVGDQARYITGANIPVNGGLYTSF